MDEKDNKKERMTTVMVEGKKHRIPHWVTRAWLKCEGCHDDFYNHRVNATCPYCWSLDKSFIGLKGKPKCYH